MGNDLEKSTELQSLEQTSPTEPIIEESSSSKMRSIKKMAQVSNFNILMITAVLFGVFVIAEVIGALVSY